MSEGFEVRFSHSAQRALTEGLPEKVAAAAFEFVVSVLADNPYRVGKELKQPMHGLYVARRGEYRVIYRVLDKPQLVEVISVLHRRDAYRPH